MDIDSLTIGEAKKLAALFVGQPSEARVEWRSGNLRPVIIRSQMAGVQFGLLVGYEGREVHLRDARQMWQWKAAKGGTLLDCATYGIAKSGSKLSAPVTGMIALEVSAIIDCTKEAAESIGAAKWE